jgi:hypothetical protein
MSFSEGFYHETFERASNNGDRTFHPCVPVTISGWVASCSQASPCHSCNFDLTACILTFLRSEGHDKAPQSNKHDYDFQDLSHLNLLWTDGLTDVETYLLT